MQRMKSDAGEHVSAKASEQRYVKMQEVRLVHARTFYSLLCDIIFSSLLRPPSVLRDIRKGEPRHWRYAKCAFLPEPAQQIYYTACNMEMQDEV